MILDAPTLAKRSRMMGATDPDQPHNQTAAPRALHASTDGRLRRTETTPSLTPTMIQCGKLACVGMQDYIKI